MPGTTPSSYSGLPSVPVRHTIKEVHKALENEIQDSKRDALEYNVQWKDAYLLNQRTRTLSGDAKPKFLRSHRISSETNYTGLA